MKKIAIALLLGGFCAGIAAAQQPQQAPAQPPAKEMKKEGKPEAKKEHIKMFKGVVEAVDAAAGRLTIKDHKGKKTDFTVAPEVAITKAGKQAALTDIAVGDKVHIAYEGEMNAPLLKSIKVEKPEARKEMKKEMKKESKPEEKKM